MGSPVPSLRRLSSEISRFRSGEVQESLSRLPVSGLLQTAPPSQDASPADLHAYILALRAELAEILASRDEAIRDAKEAKAAARAAELALASADRELHSTRVGAKAEVDGLQKLVDRLTRERAVLAEESAQKTNMLRLGTRSNKPDIVGTCNSPSLDMDARCQSLQQKSVVDPRLASGLRGESPGNLYATPATEKEEKILRNELDVLRSLADSSAVAVQQERAVHKECLAQSERQLIDLRSELATVEASKIAMAKEQSVRESNLRTELVSSKTELASRIVELSHTRAELNRVESQLFKLESRARQAEASVAELNYLKNQLETLKAGTSNVEASSVTIATLKEEVHQMSTWIRAISHDGNDLDQGLAILRAAAAERRADCPSDTDSQRLGNAASAFAANEAQQRRIAFARLNTQIAELTVKLASVDEERTKIASERDELRSIHRRSEQMRRLLEIKCRHLKNMLNDVETSVEANDTGVSDIRARVQEQLSHSSDQVNAYKSLAEEFERSLKEKDVEICNLKACGIINSNLDAGLDQGSSTANGLRSQLMEAIREASSAAAARDIAEKKQKEAEESLKMLKSELMSFQNQQADKLDYNPADVKVIRLRGSPLYSRALYEEYTERKAKRRRLQEALEGRNKNGTLEARVLELEKRNEELEKLSKLGERTKEIARRKIEEVRQACFVLFGWSMRINGATYRLSSIYAEDREDELEFGVIESGGMALHETGYATRLSDEINQLVIKWKSIPALLATVTLNNFEKTTLISD